MLTYRTPGEVERRFRPAAPGLAPRSRLPRAPRREARPPLRDEELPDAPRHDGLAQRGPRPSERGACARRVPREPPRRRDPGRPPLPSRGGPPVDARVGRPLPRARFAERPRRVPPRDGRRRDPPRRGPRRRRLRAGAPPSAPRPSRAPSRCWSRAPLARGRDSAGNLANGPRRAHPPATRFPRAFSPSALCVALAAPSCGREGVRARPGAGSRAATAG